METIHHRLETLGIKIPVPPTPAANYVPYIISRNHVFISGQLPIAEGVIQYKGRVGEDIDISTAQSAARLCGINLLSILNDACHGDLDKVQQCLRLGGFVNCTPNFTDHPKVINGVSDLMIDVFGSTGRHARAAIGCNSLPLGACVEVEAVFYIR